MSKLIRGSVGVMAVLALVGCAPKEEAPAPESASAMEEETATIEPLMAAANLAPRSDGTAHGTITFTQIAGGVTITAHIEGAPPGPHGLHVHEIGDCSSEDFKSAGGHFNPTEAPHGAPTDAERHAGDLGNIEVGDSGAGHLELSSDLLTVTEGPNSTVGRAVILHDKADDLASQPTGAAGGRIACGVVELVTMEGSEGEESEPEKEGN
jgi:Cu-Zn family superoxide dismutase